VSKTSLQRRYSNPQIYAREAFNDVSPPPMLNFMPDFFNPSNNLTPRKNSPVKLMGSNTMLMNDIQDIFHEFDSKINHYQPQAEPPV
jgi:hypothetical protein